MPLVFLKTDHSGIVWNCWTRALAYLGAARTKCFALENLAGADADRVLALAAYKDFLTLSGETPIPRFPS